MKRRKGSRQSLSLQKCRRSGPCEVIAIGQMCACFTAALWLPRALQGCWDPPCSRGFCLSLRSLFSSWQCLSSIHLFPGASRGSWHRGGVPSSSGSAAVGKAGLDVTGPGSRGSSTSQSPSPHVWRGVRRHAVCRMLHAGKSSSI